MIEIITEFKIKLDEFQKSDEWINRGENKVKDVEAEFLAEFSDNIFNHIKTTLKLRLNEVAYFTTKLN